MIAPPPGEAEAAWEMPPGGEGPEVLAEEKDQLPGVEELIGRIPSAALAAMDELFRAKWTGVRRIPGNVLGPPPEGGQ
jgi:hypothetical protein